MKDSKHYRESYETNRMLERFQSYRTIVKKDFSKLISDILRNIPDDSLKILDVGGGNGKSTIQIIGDLSKAGIDFSIDYMDASDIQAADYCNVLRSAGFGKNVRRIERTSWEEFHIQDAYHVVLALHSWYGIDNWEDDDENNTLRKVVNCLEPNGRAYITIAQRGSIWDLIGRNTGLIRTTGEDIAKALDKLGIRYQKHDLHDDNVEFSELYDAGLTKEGKAIVSFILRRDFSSLTEKEQRIVTETIAEMRTNPGFDLDDLIIIPGE